MSRKWLTIPFFLWLPTAAVADPPPPPAKPPSAKAQQKAAQQAAQQAAKTQAQAAKQQARAAQQALNAPKLPAGLTLQRLSQMTPQQRADSLRGLPPAMQQRIERSVENYARTSPEQQRRVEDQLGRLQALPPEKRALARGALAQLRNTPQPRAAVINQELYRLGAMTDQQRANYMSRPAFHSRFSESEIEMMNNLRGIVP